MLKASFIPYTLRFAFEAITSREHMFAKQTYFIKIWDDEHPETTGVGECALFRGLSYDDRPDYASVLSRVCDEIHLFNSESFKDYPSIVFGVETALADLRNGGHMLPFHSDWTDGRRGLPINGLVWMGTAEEMERRAAEKIDEGFRCVKLKIGGCDFESEFRILDRLRHRFGPEKLEIRLDANGAFKADDALDRLRRLAALDIHSIEQPVAAHQWDAMRMICADSPVDIALDEELIGIVDDTGRQQMLEAIHPAYIILKPALCGGFSGSESWIKAAAEAGVKWWVTSALESNIGLNALAQWVATLHTEMPSGLGTGQLYTNNFRSAVGRRGPMLYFNPDVAPERPEI